MPHTPGPWNRNIPPARKYGTIFAGQNKHVCHLATGGMSDDEIEANCSLIVAAPDLLAALKLALADLLDFPGPTTDAMRAAIAKAEAL